MERAVLPQGDGIGDWMLLAFVHAGVPIALVGSDERFLAASEAFAALLGCTVEDVVGSSVADLCSPDSATALRRCWRSSSKSGRRTAWEQSLPRAGGAPTVLTHGTALRNPEGRQALLLTVEEPHGPADAPVDGRVEQPALVRDLKEALRSNGLQLFYQPIVSLASGAVTGVEALLRWMRPGAGAVSPAVFVPLIERAGLSAELDRYVLRQACRDFPAIAEAFGPTARVSVNVSAQNVSDRLERCVLDALKGSGMPGRNLVLEITESAVMHDPEAACASLERLRRREIMTALDDFGTGYSSLGYLARLPVARVKIDRVFVRDLAQDADALALTSAVIELARSLRLDTVAEGIEQQEQLDVLRQLGCLAGQGFLWSPAVSVEDLPSLAGQLARRAQASSPGGGHRPARGRAEPREATAAHGLNVMIRLKREGASAASIAAALNAAGYRTPRGKRWHGTSVDRVLATLHPQPSRPAAPDTTDSPPGRDPLGVSGAA
jgi:PAS domain S-box-containing protein